MNYWGVSLQQQAGLTLHSCFLQSEFGRCFKSTNKVQFPAVASFEFLHQEAIIFCISSESSLHINLQGFQKYTKQVGGSNFWRLRGSLCFARITSKFPNSGLEDLPWDGFAKCPRCTPPSPFNGWVGSAIPMTPNRNKAGVEDTLLAGSKLCFFCFFFYESDMQLFFPSPQTLKNA